MTDDKPQNTEERDIDNRILEVEIERNESAVHIHTVDLLKELQRLRAQQPQGEEIIEYLATMLTHIKTNAQFVLQGVDDSTGVGFTALKPEGIIKICDEALEEYQHFRTSLTHLRPTPTPEAPREAGNGQGVDDGWLCSAEWAEAERLIDKEIRDGKVSPTFDSVGEFLKSLGLSKLQPPPSPGNEAK